MPKNGKKSGGAKLLGPLDTGPSGKNLGPTRVDRPARVSPPDPLGFAHGTLRRGPGSQQRAQSHDLE